MNLKSRQHGGNMNLYEINDFKGFFWTRKLPGCLTCENTLTAPSGVSQSCAVDASNKNVCKMTCDNGGNFDLGNKTLKTVALKCKCTRNKITKERISEK